MIRWLFKRMKSARTAIVECPYTETLGRWDEKRCSPIELPVPGAREGDAVRCEIDLNSLSADRREVFKSCVKVWGYVKKDGMLNIHFASDIAYELESPYRVNVEVFPSWKSK